MTQFDKFVTELAHLGNVDMNIEDGVAHCEIELGSIAEGIAYTGLWGSGTTSGQLSTRAVFKFGDLYGENNPDDPELGTVTIKILTVEEEAGLVYTSSLESMLNDMLSSATDNLLTLSGSEQGMQDLNGTVQLFNADLSVSVAQPVLH